jgi:cytidylate kinase
MMPAGAGSKTGTERRWIMPPRTLEKIIDEQIRKWEITRAKEAKEEATIPVITLSREPGSGGRIIAEKLAKELGLDLFHQDIVQKMAESARTSARLLQTLDEKGLSVLEDWIATLVHERHLWPDQYLRHLMKVIGAIGRHGQAVIIGRGANFILPPQGQLKIRIVAPLEVRVQNVIRTFGASHEDAMRRVLKTESERRAFIRKYFHADIASSANYDLVINTGRLSIDAAVGAVIGALERQKGFS